MTLEQAQPCDLVKVVSVSGESVLRRRILDMGLTPNAEVYVVKKAPFGCPIEITVRGYELTLRKEEAKNIEIELLKKGKCKKDEKNCSCRKS